MIYSYTCDTHSFSLVLENKMIHSNLTSCLSPAKAAGAITVCWLQVLLRSLPRLCGGTLSLQGATHTLSHTMWPQRTHKRLRQLVIKAQTLWYSTLSGSGGEKAQSASHQISSPIMNPRRIFCLEPLIWILTVLTLSIKHSGLDFHAGAEQTEEQT